MAKVLEKSNVVALSEMKDGDVAEVVKWWNDSVLQGTLVQRYGNDFMLIVHPLGKGCDFIFDNKHINDILVSILPKGTKIIL